MQPLGIHARFLKIAGDLAFHSERKVQLRPFIWKHKVYLQLFLIIVTFPHDCDGCDQLDHSVRPHCFLRLFGYLQQFFYHCPNLFAITLNVEWIFGP